MPKRHNSPRCPDHWSLERRIAQFTRLDPLSGCLIWQRRATRCGYGQITYKYKTSLVHRLNWMLRHGPIPAGMVLCHRCDEKLCVNPDHLFLGTRGDNMADLKAKRLLCSDARATDDATIRIIYRGVELVGQVKVLAVDPRIQATRVTSESPLTPEKEQT